MRLRIPRCWTRNFFSSDYIDRIPQACQFIHQSSLKATIYAQQNPPLAAYTHTPKPTTPPLHHRLSSAANTLFQYPLKCIFSPSAAISATSSSASRNAGTSFMYPLSRSSLALVVTATTS